MKPRARGPLVLLALMATVLAIAAVGIGMAQSADAATIIVPDDYTTIQEAIDNAGSGDTIRVYAGTYNENIDINVAVDVVGNGTAVSVIQGSSSDTVVMSASGASISMVKVTGGANSGISMTTSGCVVEDVLCTANARGINLNGADDNYIGNSTMTGNSYAGIGVYSGSDSNVFFNVNADSNGLFGLDVFTNCDGNTWESCSFDLNTGNGILINGGSDDNRVANSTVDGNGNYGISVTQGASTTIYGCSVNDNTANDGIVIYTSVSDNIISHVQVDNSGGHGINVIGDVDSNYDNLTISNSSGDGFHGDGITRVSVMDSSIFDNGNNGIYVINSADVMMNRNVVRDNVFGFNVELSANTEVGDSSVRDNDGVGVGIFDCTSGTHWVHDNDIERNGLVYGGLEAGVMLGGLAGANGVTVERNLVTGNNKGMVLFFGGTNGNMIIDNVIENNVVYGIENFFNPGPNNFYHNNFINNPTHVRTPHNLDVFDNGYPSGGNFWDDYMGTDVANGPAQDMLGSDGIGDTTYTVSGAIVDNYPLVGPVNDPLDAVFITHPEDGSLVSGVVVADVAVVSVTLTQVVFYLDGAVVGRDTSAPYQLVLDTTSLTEDASYTLMAVAERRVGTPISDSVTFTVNNQVMTGSYLSVATVSSTYMPDDRATAIVTLTTPPNFDEINLHVEYLDPSGNRTMLPDMPYKASMKYGFTFWLPSDITAGTVTLEVTGGAYLRGSQVWTSTDTTTFAISGSSLQQEMAAIQATLATVLADIDNMNTTTQAQLAMSLAQTLSAIDSMGTYMELTLAQMWADYNATEDANLLTLVTAMSTMWDGLNNSARMGFDEVLAGLDLTETNITTELSTLEAYLAGEITLSQQEVQQSLAVVWQGLNSSFVALDDAIQGRLDELEVIMADNSTALKEYMDLQTVQLGLYMDVINASLQLRLDAIDKAIEDFRLESLDGLMTISAFLVAMEANGTGQYEDVMEAIDDTQTLIETIDDTSLADLRDGLVVLHGDLIGLNTTEGMRHANTVDTMIVELDGLSDQVGDGFNSTDSQLQALSKLDTIMAELDRMSGDLEETKEAVSEGGSDPMLILLLILLIGLMTLALIIVGMQRIRSLRLAPEEPPVGGREPPLEPMAIEVPLEPEPVAPEPMAPEPVAPEPVTPEAHGYEMMMEEPIMNPPSTPIIMDVETVPTPPPEVPVEPGPGHAETWAEEILDAEGVPIADESPEADAAEVIYDESEVEEISPDELYGLPPDIPPEASPEAPPEAPAEPPEELTEVPPEEIPEEPTEVPPEEGEAPDDGPYEGDDDGPGEEPEETEKTAQDWVIDEVMNEI